MSEKTRTLLVHIETNCIACGGSVEIEVPEDATDDEIKEHAEEAFFETCNYGWGWADEDE